GRGRRAGHDPRPVLRRAAQLEPQRLAHPTHPRRRHMYRIGVDTGGTFTDCVIIDRDGRVGVGKALSTHHDLSIGICDAIENAAHTVGLGLDDALRGADLLAHATTVGINALLTGTGARVGVVTTAGFEATVPIARGNKVIGIEERLRTEAVHWEKPAL